MFHFFHVVKLILQISDGYDIFIQMHYGKAIRLLRTLKGLSQQKVAELLSITQQAYSKMEKHEWMDREKITAVLNCLKSSWKELEIVNRLLSSDQ